MDTLSGTYGGPNAYFSNVNAAQTSCRINFIKPLPPLPTGGTTYFSLENRLTGSNACSTVLNQSIPAMPTLVNSNTEIRMTLTPQGINPLTGKNYTLTEAAQLCGFIEFNWQSIITNVPNPRPIDPASGNGLFTAANAPTVALVTPFNDPPPSGYYYQTKQSDGANAVELNVYYNMFISGRWWSLGNAVNTNAAGTQLTFIDSVGDPCLPGPQSAAVAAAADAECGGPGKRAPVGSTINFTTHVVGIQGALPGAGVVDTGVGFNWTSNFNGTTGGITALGNILTADPGSGTGGVTVTSVNQISTYAGVGVTAINGSNNIFAPTSLLTAALPESRSVQVNGTATAFATIINTGTNTATGCSIAPASGLPLTFVYQTTNPITNAVTGSPNTPVNIAAGASQSFVIALTPTAAIAPIDVGFNFNCTNTTPAPIVTGLSTLLFSASTTPTPDIVALAATATNDGIVHVPGASGVGAFAVATVNLGAGASITAAANTGDASLPLTITMCQTNPKTGQCLQTPSAKVPTTINAGTTPTFAVFVAASGTVPFDPANSRVFVQFTDSSNAVRGETSVAVETQ